MRVALVCINPFSILWEREEIPNTLQWPNGDIAFSPLLGIDHNGYRLVQINYVPKIIPSFYTEGSISYSLNNELLTATRELVADPLDGVKKEICNRIDAGAEEIRSDFITAGSGQAMIYREKLLQARACKNDPSPLPNNYPLLAVSIGIEGNTITDVANVVINANSKWISINAKIEASRLAAKQSVNNAATVDVAVSIFNKISWSVFP